METPEKETGSTAGKTVPTPPPPEIELPIDAPMEKDPETGAPRTNLGKKPPLEAPPGGKPKQT